MAATPAISSSGEFGPRASAFYRRVLETLQQHRVDFLVGGSFSFHRHTGIERPTKDIDVFLRRGDLASAMRVLREAGFEAELTYPHWLAKVRRAGACVDLIFSGGNGLTSVDDAWFERAPEASVLGLRVGILPLEELIWSKAFVMERERYDGADVVHLIAAGGDRIDWAHLRSRFAGHEHVLLAHLVLFDYVYPDKRDLVPSDLMRSLVGAVMDAHDAPSRTTAPCRGTLLSREQYLHDLEACGAIDARLPPHGNLSGDDVASWTNAIPRARRVGLRRARARSRPHGDEHAIIPTERAP